MGPRGMGSHNVTPIPEKSSGCIFLPLRVGLIDKFGCMSIRIYIGVQPSFLGILEIGIFADKKVIIPFYISSVSANLCSIFQNPFLSTIMQIMWANFQDF